MSSDEDVLARPIKEEVEDDPLIALDKLDRVSPEMWQDKLPGFKNFLTMSDTPVHTSPPTWARGVAQDDIAVMHQLGVMSTNALIAEIKKIHDEAYKLGMMEAKEMTKGKYIGIFNNSKKK